ncbi:PQQ-binding-like beta-propeller repeat protein [Agreia sp. VKM Ac-1783]|uniref:outer membrane protein assembly factor BamB family protein n=1 Tax=Agreia sp. VKM Ac-1783 TaxID=1938889 RepID=UPI000A2AD08B|nr:PQQ-binding-like beta-propeller repeat protein [Agreia sp. VKM Ac-1783]SMQ60426.1 PQQ-like domain-containing protein [Agreia sp. VKM Ac-1783]
MTDNPKFSPKRSAAIRQLLIENVEAEPRRRTSHLRAFLAGLIITGIVASGSTALALNRDSLFGSPAPSAVPTTTTATPPTTTPTPSPTTVTLPPPAVTVSEAPILPHDVPSAPSGTGWSLDLPHSDEPCQIRQAYTVSDGFALVQVGPIRTDDNVNCLRTNDGMTLSLVDTSSGKLLWSRDWHWDTESEGQGSAEVDTTVLGTSGRVLVDSVRDRAGPSEVLDLATGQTVAAFEPSSGGQHVSEVSPVPGDSGDVYASFRELDANGQEAAYGTVKRLDPRNAQNPVWSTRVEGTAVGIKEVTNGLGFTALTYTRPGQPRVSSAVLDLTTGAVSYRDGFLDYRFFTGYTIRPSNLTDPQIPVILTGLDDNGEQLWTRTEDAGSTVNEVLTPAVKLGDLADVGPQVGNGQFVVGSPTNISLVDGKTGDTIWTADATGCGIRASADASYVVRISADNDALLLDTLADQPCRFDQATGARLTDFTQPRMQRVAYGTLYNYSIADGTGTAYDAKTGEVLWSIPTDAFWWMYAGGHLVYFDGFTLRSVG